MTIYQNLSLLFKGFCMSLLVLAITACDDHYDINSRLDAIENELNAIKEAISNLEEAHAKEKHILSVESSTDEITDLSTWKITFSDNSIISIPDADNGVLGIIDVVNNDDDRSVTLTLSDGREFDFHLAGPSASAIILLDDSGVTLKPNGRATFRFRINPSDADLNLDIESPSCQIALDIVGDATRSSLLVNSPKEFKIVEISQSVFEDGKAIPGQYEMTIADLGIALGYSYSLVLVVAGEGSAQISSYPFSVSSSVDPAVMSTGLPVVVITTPNESPIVSKNDWMKDASMFILDQNGNIDYQGSLSVKGRGNTTWSNPKKPYALKLDKKSEILQMNKHKRWCLLANWMDRTMIRNAVAFEISRQTGLQYTPSGQFVELVVNGKHLGNYYLTEQIKVDENRVNITELDPDATDEESINGGYLFELDTYFDEVFKFKSEIRNLPWMFKDPDEVNEAQFEYMRAYVNNMERALYDEDEFRSRAFVDYMDLESFVDWWFVYELTMNGEPNHPKSTYFHKDLGGKMIAGPVWDFDWGTFNPSSTNSYSVINAVYYNRLFKDEEFVRIVKERWVLLKPQFDSIISYIDGLKAHLAKSDEINSVMWPITQTTNGDEASSFNDAVDRLKSAYSEKMSWLDNKIGNM